MKIVINTCFGGFGLSDECAIALGATIEQTGITGFSIQRFPDHKCAQSYRTDPKLIHLIETKGSDWCSGHYAKLKVVEIPDNVEWEIDDYDGVETVEEVHRSWC